MAVMCSDVEMLLGYGGSGGDENTPRSKSMGSESQVWYR